MSGSIIIAKLHNKHESSLLFLKHSQTKEDQVSTTETYNTIASRRITGECRWYCILYNSGLENPFDEKVSIILWRLYIGCIEPRLYIDDSRFLEVNDKHSELRKKSLSWLTAKPSLHIAARTKGRLEHGTLSRIISRAWVQRKMTKPIAVIAVRRKTAKARNSEWKSSEWEKNQEWRNSNLEIFVSFLESH